MIPAGSKNNARGGLFSLRVVATHLRQSTPSGVLGVLVSSATIQSDAISQINASYSCATMKVSAHTSPWQTLAVRSYAKHEVPVALDQMLHYTHYDLDE